MRDDDKIYPAKGNQTTNCVINFVAHPIFLSTSLSRFFIFSFAYACACCKIRIRLEVYM